MNVRVPANWKGCTLSGLIPIVYTTAGGVIGAGITQYVTHIRDRRSTRALVIERLSEVEEAYIALRWPTSNDTPYSHSRVAKLLSSLEAAALVAGVPKSVLTCYVVSCQAYEDARRISRGADFLSAQLAEKVTQNAQALSVNPNLSAIKKSLTIISENVVHVKSTTKEMEKHVFALHDASYSLLIKVIWRPIKFQFNRRRLRSLRKSAAALELNNRKMGDLLRQMESFYTEASTAGFIQNSKTPQSSDSEVSRVALAPSRATRVARS